MVRNMSKISKTSKVLKKRINILRNPKAAARLHISTGTPLYRVSILGLHRGYQEAEDFIIIKCEDGVPACVLKDIDKAFPLYGKDFSSK